MPFKLILTICFDRVFGITKSRVCALDLAFVVETAVMLQSSGPSADLFDRSHEPAVTRLDDADPARSVVFVSEDEGGIPAAVEVQRDRDRVLLHRFEDVPADRQALSVPIVRVDNPLCSHEHGVVVLILAGEDLLDCT